MFARTRNILAALMQDLRRVVIRAQRRVDPDQPDGPSQRELSEPPKL